METKKQKIIKVLKRIGICLSIGFNFLFLLAIIIGSVGNKKQVNCCLAESDSVVEKVNNVLPKRYVSYNDESYSITFSADELNNYDFVNFSSYLQVNISGFNSDNTNISYYSACEFGSKNEHMIEFYTSDTTTYDFAVRFNFNASDVSLNHKFYVSDENEGVRVNFDNSLTWVFPSLYYEGIKSAIALDIQANESNINDGIFETLTSGVVAFIGSIGAGISSMVGVFYDSANSQLTTIGLLSVIVVAVSLAYFLFRLIIGLIRMRG